MGDRLFTQLNLKKNVPGFLVVDGSTVGIGGSVLLDGKKLTVVDI